MDHRKRLERLWKWLFAITVLVFLFPVRLTLLKVAMLAGGASFWALTFYLFKEKLWIRSLCLITAAAFGASLVFLLLPGKAVDKQELSSDYIHCLNSYKGTIYIWGGGSHLGIDCSGLVERAMIDAEMQQAITTGNPALARDAVSLWWHNRSARALGNGYRGDTREVEAVGSLDNADYREIHAGDIAVMADGTHVLAYLGHSTWIEAYPPFARSLKLPQENDEYFTTPVKVMRWRMLDSGTTTAG